MSMAPGPCPATALCRLPRQDDKILLRCGSLMSMRILTSEQGRPASDCLLDMRDTCIVPLIPIVGILALHVPCFTEPPPALIVFIHILPSFLGLHFRLSLAKLVMNTHQGKNQGGSKVMRLACMPSKP